MDILKRLSLNRTPKDVQNGSIICAKNMMVDDTGSFLTNDIGFKETCSFSEGEKIVGVIPCSEEIVILTYNGTNSKVYRKHDYNSPVKEVVCSWKYNGGKITGTYTYNYKGELVLVIAESGVSGKNIPLKSFVIKEHLPDTVDGQPYYYAEENQTYGIEETIPKFSANYSITNNGELVCGVYTFFIRFKVDKINKTKWFQLSGDIIITHNALYKNYVHRFLLDNNIKYKTKSSFKVNTDKYSNNAINLFIHIEELDGIKYDEFELGYIIKRDSDIQARVKGTYKIAVDTEVTISNNLYAEEESVDAILESPHQFFNVENVINYNNRLYIANYKEYDVEDYSNHAKNIIIESSNETINVEAAANSDSLEHKLTFKMVYDFTKAVGYMPPYAPKYRSYDITIPKVVTDINGKVTNPDVIKNKLKEYLYLWDTAFYHGELYFSDSNHNVNLYLFIQPKNTPSSAFCILNDITHAEYSDTCYNWGWDFTLVSYDFYIKNNALYIKYNDEEYNIIGNDVILCVLGYREVQFDSATEYEYWFGPGLSFSEYEARSIYNPPAQMPPIPSLIDFHDDNPISGGGIIDDEGDVPSEGGTGVSSVNRRSLIPKQKYNLFIHYVRKDGSCTPGYFIDCVSFNISSFIYPSIIIPKFSNIENPNPNEFVGYFISYEDVERNCDCVYIADKDGSKQYITNASYIYDLNTIRTSRLWTAPDTYIDFNVDSAKYVENRLMYNHVQIDSSSVIENQMGLVTRTINNQYSNKVKTLYRFTKTFYEFNTESSISSVSDKDYLPDFLNTQTLITYNIPSRGLIINGAISVVLGVNNIDASDADQEPVANGTPTDYMVYITIPVMYSRYPTEAMNVKEDFTQLAVVLDWEELDNNGDTIKHSDTYINCLVSPDKLHDFLELKACYSAKPSKTYINFNENSISRFDKTIYRSDVVSDESLVNRFRHFGPTNYKNILENKGKITNIVGIGLYLIVHTEYSMFVFDRSPKLTSKYQMNVPDTFDVDYQEVMPSNEGFGGLKYKEESILSKNGYIWFDRTNGIIFNYVNGKAAILSADINNFIKYVGVDTIRFAEDIIHNRIIICIKDYEGKYSTISYSFYTNSFISLHDYKFTNNYRTYNKSYMFDETYNNVLFEFDDAAIADYKQLQLSSSASLYPTIKSGNKYYSYVDIIFNEIYETSKVLNSIEYTLNEIRNKFIDTILSEELLYRRFSGDSIRIYTDETDSGVLNIHVPTTGEIDVRNQGYNDDNLNIMDEYSSPISPLEGYKYPVFEKGVWFLNYFRNYLVSENPYDSDEKTLIHGKYFVIRFIFNNDRKVKLDTLDVNVNPY